MNPFRVRNVSGGFENSAIEVLPLCSGVFMLAVAAFLYVAVAGIFFYVGLRMTKAEKGDTVLAALTALVWPASALAVIVHARHWRESHALYFQERGL